MRALDFGKTMRRLASIFGNHRIALGFVIGIALATITIVLLLVLIESTGDAVYHDYTTSKAYADAYQKFRNECLGRASVQELLGCLNHVTEAAREPQRAEEDLQAQKQMAVWARWMFYATFLVGVVSVIVAVVGIVLVSSTLELQRAATAETAKAAQAAIESNEISRADLRPWVSVDPKIDSRLGTSCDLIWMDVRLTLKNHGKAPATRTTMDCKLVAVRDVFELVAAAEQFCRSVLSQRMDDDPTGDVIFPGEEPTSRKPLDMKINDLALIEQIPREGPRKRAALVSLISCVAYDWTGEKKVHATCAVHNLIRLDENGRRHEWFSAEPQTVQPDRLLLERSTEGFAD
jgi:hypothetical protein